MPAISAASGSRFTRRQSSDNGALRLCFAVGLLFQTPIFVMQMTQDPVLQKVLQIGNFLCFVLGAAVIASLPNPRKVLLTPAAPMLLVGLGFLSLTWSINPGSTFRTAYILLGTTLFSAAMCARYSPSSSMQLIIRVMAFVCLLSAICAIFFPDIGLHPPDDHVEEHRGLWRGVFSHKQGLGVQAGLTAGILLFYGSFAFPSTIIRFGALGSALACVAGSASATGLLITLVLPSLLYTTSWMTRSSAAARRTVLWILGGFVVLFYLAFQYNLFGFIMPLLGKSEDLTGRADFWPWVIGNLRATAPLLGGGFGGGLAGYVAPDVSIDNGFIVLLVDFGYVGGGIILALYLRSMLGAARAILLARPDEVKTRIFPLNIFLIALFIGISETPYMTKDTVWVLVLTSMYHTAEYQRGLVRHAPGARRVGTDTASPPTPRYTRGPAYQQSADSKDLRG
jgi:exopolysaccharide production protein ExoQ